MTIRKRGRALAIVVPVAIAIALVVWQWIAADDGGDSPATVTVGTTAIGRPIAPGFIGLSLEFPAVPAYAGTDPAQVNPLFVRLIQNLSPGQSPVLRIGGDSTDYTWWPVPGQDPPPGSSYALTSDWLAVARALAVAVGGKLILGVNLAAGDPGIASAEATAFMNGIGRQYIDALEIGNEPDLYGLDPWYRGADGKPVFARPRSYSFRSFVDDFSRWRQSLPQVPLAGPAFAWLPWMHDLGQFLAAEPGVGLVTFHRYPLRRCNQSASSPLYGSIPNLLSSFSSIGLADAVAPFASVAHAHGLPFRVDEINSVSCHGMPGVSDSFASALWALGTMLDLARAGVDGVNVHTFPGAAYQLFSFQRAGDSWSATVEPEYYGLELFAQAAPAGARLLRVSEPGGHVQAWATLAPDGTTRLVLINYSRTAAPSILIRPPSAPGVARIERLTAPSAGATTGVSLQGASPDTAAPIAGSPGSAYLVPVGSGYRFTLGSASAAVLTLIPGMRR